MPRKARRPLEPGLSRRSPTRGPVLLRWAAGLWLLLAIAAGCGSARADAEGIASFESRVDIRADGHATITETIGVEARGRQIVHGIYRDLPNADPPFEVRRVLRNGRAESFHIEPLRNGQRIYFGSAGVALQPGPHIYTLVYDTRNLITFLPERDELYYNVTGNDWRFPIDTVKAWIALPAGAQVLELDAWTGPPGSRDRNCTIGTAQGGPLFTTTRSLAPGEGLTIGVAFAKGTVSLPTPAPSVPNPNKAPASFHRHAGLLAALAAALLALVSHFLIWYRLGRDPAKGPIIPRFAPPPGCSPAACRYLLRMRFDNICLAADLLSMAVKGHIRILETHPRHYAVQRENANAPLSPDEAEISHALFAQSERFELTQGNRPQIRSALQALQARLKRDFQRASFSKNGVWLLPGVLLSGAGVAALLWFDTAPERRAFAAFMSLWISAFLAAVMLLLARSLRHTPGEGSRRLAPALLAALLLGGAAWLGLPDLVQKVGPTTIGVTFALTLLNILFARLLRAPTPRGRRIMDEIEGLRLYLSVAEQPRFEQLHPPDRTPEHFEALLPYALALGVEHAWSQGFSQALEHSAADPKHRGQRGWQPGWYSGAAFRRCPADFASGFSSSIASASRAGAGRSSGFGRGGGSSGGGSGGGGGGGW